jgi:hypothetical protein
LLVLWTHLPVAGAEQLRAGCPNGREDRTESGRSRAAGKGAAV